METDLPRNAYRFQTTWHFAASLEEVSEILQDVEGLPRWWTSVYQQVQVLEPGDSTGVGKRVRVSTRGLLPYALRWEFVVEESGWPHAAVIRANGDLVGRGEWSLSARDHFVEVRYRWEVTAEKPILKALSAFLRPVFEWNHRWAMRQGERAVIRELMRKRIERQPITQEVC